MAIAALVLWVLTAAAGVALLAAGNAARRAAAPAPAPLPAPVRPVPRRARPGRARALRPIPRVTVHAAPGEHPLLEFSHPALGLLGLGCWFIYVGTRHVALAWVAFGILVVTILAGLGWLGRSALARGAGTAPGRRPVPLPAPAGPAARRRRGGHGGPGRPHRPVRHPLTGRAAACEPGSPARRALRLL